MLFLLVLLLTPIFSFEHRHVFSTERVVNLKGIGRITEAICLGNCFPHLTNVECAWKTFFNSSTPYTICCEFVKDPYVKIGEIRLVCENQVTLELPCFILYEIKLGQVEARGVLLCLMVLVTLMLAITCSPHSEETLAEHLDETYSMCTESDSSDGESDSEDSPSSDGSRSS